MKKGAPIQGRPLEPPPRGRTEQHLASAPFRGRGFQALPLFFESFSAQVGGFRDGQIPDARASYKLSHGRISIDHERNQVTFRSNQQSLARGNDAATRTHPIASE